MKKSADRTKCADDIALARKYGVSDRTIREWKSKGYPVEDRAKLFDCLAEQRTQPDWFTWETRRREFIARERRTQLELHGGWGESIQGALLSMGWKMDDMPWPYAYGRDLTAEERNRAEMTDEETSRAAYNEYWLGVIRSDQFTGEPWDKIFKGDIEGAKAAHFRQARQEHEKETDDEPDLVTEQAG